MSDVPVNEEAKNELLKLMRSTLKFHHLELIGQQAILWKQITEDNGEQQKLHVSEVEKLKKLSLGAGGWWTDLDKDEPKFVSLAQWQLIRSEHGLL